MPDRTATEFTPDGYFKTGDLGVVDDEGYVSIVGRSKDLIISGGYNVYPKEIEMWLDDFEGVDESAVIGVPHPDFGEAVTAIIKLLPGHTLSAESIVLSAREALANYKVPKRVFFVEDLPRNTMGKVQKAELRSRFDWSRISS
jgi:malonyl-CoA/methylmalonyl-CoA synthetase